MNEDDARRVLLVRAVEVQAPGPLWSGEDRTWASRAAHEAPPDRFLAERARHAAQRLAARDAGLGRWLQRRTWRSAWWIVAVAVGAVVGIAIDSVGASQRIELLSPPLLGVIVWNLAVYALLLAGWPRRARAIRGVRAWLRRSIEGVVPDSAGPLRDASLAWADVGAPLHGARAASLLHLAAAALGAGLVAGLYARGLVLDYRAGWQSTFLDAAQVHALLAAWLAPASAITGIMLPGVDAIAAMRVGAGEPARAQAAPWIHLHAMTLALLVIAPRLLLAGVAVMRATRLARDLPLPTDTPYFQRLLRAHRGEPAEVQIVPHAVAAGARAQATLRAAASTVFGAAVRVIVAAPVAFGNEDAAAPPPSSVSTPATLRIALFDATATPEAEQQGRLLDALGGAAPVLAIVDEAAFARRFASMPGRRDERRAAWQRLAIGRGVRVVVVDLEAGDTEALAAEIEAALRSEVRVVSGGVPRKVTS